MVVDHVDEVHGFLIETEQAQPFLEVHMLVLHLFDEVGEKDFHFLLKVEQFWDFDIRVLADNILEFGPLHLFAFLVEECTLAVGVQAVLADEGRLSAVGVDADHVAGVAVYALGAAL